MNLMHCLTVCENVPTGGCRNCELHGQNNCTFVLAGAARKKIRKLKKELQEARATEQNTATASMTALRGRDDSFLPRLTYREKEHLARLIEEFNECYTRLRSSGRLSWGLHFTDESLEVLLKVLINIGRHPSIDTRCDCHHNHQLDAARYMFADATRHVDIEELRRLAENGPLATPTVPIVEEERQENNGRRESHFRFEPFQFEPVDIAQCDSVTNRISEELARRSAERIDNLIRNAMIHSDIGDESISRMEE